MSVLKSLAASGSMSGPVYSTGSPRAQGFSSSRPDGGTATALLDHVVLAVALFQSNAPSRRSLNGCNYYKSKFPDTPFANSQPLDPVSRRHRGHDGGREPSICLDSLHQTDSGPSPRLSRSGSVDYRIIRRSGNLARAV